MGAEGAPSVSAAWFTPARRQAAARLFALLAVIAISVFVFSIRDQAEQLAKYGYPGIFLLALLANATVLLPAPGVFVVFAMGAVFHPVGVAVAAGLGAALGELSGYLAGFSGQAVIENAALYEKLYTWMGSHRLFGYLGITLLAAIPNPFFDLAGMASGALKIPVTHFLFFCAIGSMIKMLIFAYAGASSLNWFLDK